MNSNMRIVLIMTVSFMLFATGMYFVYADTNESVIEQRLKMDATRTKISNQIKLIETLEKERTIWTDKITASENYLKTKQLQVADAENKYDLALVASPSSIATVENIKKVKADLDKKREELIPAALAVITDQQNLKTYEQRLLDAKNTLVALEKSRPNEEKILAELVTEANRNVPNRMYGSHKSIMISIILSDACLMGDTCPTYLELARIYDNSNKFISGDFELIDTGKTKPVYTMVECVGNCSVRGTLQKTSEEPIKIWKRQEPPLGATTIEWYAYSNIPVITFVDPDDQTRNKSKQIIIEPSLPVGFDKQNAISIGSNHTLTFDKDRKITGCYKATIGWKPHADELLADTWNYFYNNCSEKSTFNSTVSTYYKPTVFTDCGVQCEYIKWVNKAKELAKEYQIGKSDQ